MLWQLRPPTEADVSFIFNSWLRSLRNAPAVTDIPNGPYFAHMHAGIDAVLRSENTRLVVACSPKPGDEDVIFGYGVAEAIGDELCLHYIYTKHSFRGFGIGKAIEAVLVAGPNASYSYSCQSKLAKTLVKSRPQLVYNPFHLWSKCK